LNESIRCGVVSDITFTLGFELSPSSSLFFGAFLGAMMFVLEQKPVVEKKCISFVECNSFLSLKNKNEIWNTKPLLTLNSSYNECTDIGDKNLFFNGEDTPGDTQLC